MQYRSAIAAIIAVLAASVLTGCSHPEVVEPAPYAADPQCAQVMLNVPDVVGGLDLRETTSQATTAWGEEYPIIARCGVEPPGPTTDQCIAVETSAATVDWLMHEEDEHWIAVTFGRTPAMEITVPKIRADEAVGDVLAEFSRSAAYAPSNGLDCI